MAATTSASQCDRNKDPAATAKAFRQLKDDKSSRKAPYDEKTYQRQLAAISFIETQISQCQADVSQYSSKPFETVKSEWIERQKAMFRSSVKGPLDIGRTDVGPTLQAYEEFLGKYALQNDVPIAEYKAQLATNRQNEERKCKPHVDLRNKFPPNKNQQERGLCYGYAAADLLTYKLGRPVSPLDVGYLYKKSEEEQVTRYEDLDSGDAHKTLLQAKEHGLCKNEEFGKEETWQEVKGQMSMFILARPGPDPKTCEVNSNFSASNIQDLNNALKSALDVKIAKTLKEVCEPRTKYDNINPTLLMSINSGKEPGFFDPIDETLGKENPIAIHTSNDSVFKNHVMILVGRQWNGESCEYILRNSWGPTCEAQITAGGYKCDDKGNVIVTKSQLMDSISLATYLK